MPSFAKRDHKHGMKDVFAEGAASEVLEKLKSQATTRAKQILQHEIPSYLLHLDSILESSNSESSPLWKGHLENGVFVRAELERPTKMVIGMNIPTKRPYISRLKSYNSGFSSDVSSIDMDLDLSHHGEKELISTSVGGSVGGGSDDEKWSSGSLLDNEKQGVVWMAGLKKNEVCDTMLDMLEKECEKTIEICKDLQCWINFQIPTIEAGNNFGSEIQDAMLEKINGCISAAMKLHGLPKSHYQDRMNLAMGWAKYPNLEDHAAAIASSDRFDHFLAINAFKSLRNNMASCLNALMNNWGKTVDPKGAGEEAGSRMY